MQFDFKGDGRGKLIPLEALSGHRLDWPTKGLLIEGCVWREMKDFSKDAVLLVLASEHYDPTDYIWDHGLFEGRGGCR